MRKKFGVLGMRIRRPGQYGDRWHRTARDTSAVSEDRQLLDAILDGAASLIMVLDARGRLVRWNRACEQLLGYSAEELAAPGAVLDLIPSAERPAAMRRRAQVLAGESPVRAEFNWRTRDGALRLIDWSGTALTEQDGSASHIVATGVDVTDERRWDEERVATEERLRHIADHDALTGLFNRRRFEEELERHIAHGRRYGISGALLLIDLDDFKEVNDGYGHQAGDTVLTAVADVLRLEAARDRRRGALRGRRVRGADARRRRDRGRGAGRAAHRGGAPRGADPRRPALRERGLSRSSTRPRRATRSSRAPTTRCTPTRARRARTRGHLRSVE